MRLVKCVLCGKHKPYTFFNPEAQVCKKCQWQWEQPPEGKEEMILDMFHRTAKILTGKGNDFLHTVQYYQEHPDQLPEGAPDPLSDEFADYVLHNLAPIVRKAEAANHG